MENHESDVEGSIHSGPENDISEEEEDEVMSNHSKSEQPIKPSIDPDVLARLKQQGAAFGQEDLERSLPFFFPHHQLMASHFAAAAAANKVEKEAFSNNNNNERSPPVRYSDEHISTNQPPASDSSTSSTSSQQTWSFEEQFKQLYELSDEPSRKEFLDELFTFMQKRGTPINRLPIMAKQVLDLYELYNLVIARGGLVDVINKKLWQEIIKGLRLPSSITSAAFTLRTQYMKYLYPYECEKKRLSTPAELQAAIDGNKREGRRASYGPYSEMVSPLSLVGGRPQMNGNGTSQNMHSTSPSSPQNSQHAAQNARDALAALELSRLTLWNLYGGAAGAAPLPPDPKVPPQQEALNLEVPTRSSEGAHTPKAPSSIIPTSPRSSLYPPEKENGKRHDRQDQNNSNHHHNSNSHGPPPSKRMALEENERDRPSSRSSVSPVHGANIKINSRGDGRGSGPDTSLVVSMEINGITYQGVLFAQATPTPTRVA